MIRLLCILAAILAGPVAAQQSASANGAVLRGLDKINGGTTDFELTRGETQAFGRLRITLQECRYPRGGSTSAAYAQLTIQDAAATEPAFQGWMLARSPALNALDHPRYDVWVLRCNNS